MDGKTDAERYLTDIQDGKIIACKQMIRFAEIMLPRITDGYKKWHFDYDQCIRPVQFIERFCRIPSGKKSSQPFILEPYERMPIELAYGFVDDDGTRQIKEMLIQWARKSGKALSLDTEIPTPDGWRTMADIHIGDVVFGQDGKPSTVTAESEVFDKPMYLVTFEDGAQVKASGDHVWTVAQSFSDEWIDMTTVELAWSIQDREWNVPLPKPVEYPGADLDDDPFNVGVRCAKNKTRIPDEYMLASIEQRRKLLDGLMSVCRGNAYTHGDKYVLFVSDGIVVQQFKELASSLGVYYYAEDGCADLPCVYTPGDTGKLIKYVERIPNEPSKCIAIDNESHLYLAGRQYTATHNTSLLAALNLYMLLSDNPNERVKECYNAAASDSQAKLCYGATDAMARMSPLLSKRIRRGMVQKRGVSGLNDDKTGSYLCTVSSNGKKLDGLNTFFAVYDELAVCEDGGHIYDLITESMAGEHLKSPLLVIISTENYVRDNIYDERKNYALGWLDGTIQDDTFLPLIYQLDSRNEIFDERCWIKASPGLGVTKSYSYLRERIEKAKQSPARMPSLLCKEFNLRSSAYSSFLDINDCVNNTPIDFGEIGVPPYVCVGIDLAVKYDLCACVCRWMMPGDNRIYEIAKFWVASTMLNMESDYRQKDKVPYLLWSTMGQDMGGETWHYVDVVDGDRVGFPPVLDFLNDLVNAGIYPFCIGFDPWRFGDLEQEQLKRFVGLTRTIPVSPTLKSVSPLVREHELDLKAHRVICPNPCLHHNRSSVQVREDPQGNVQVQKRDLQPHQKIDGFMAELYSLAAFNRFKEEYLSAIEWEPPESGAQAV